MDEKIELNTAKGVRDIPAQELILRKRLMDALVRVFENYGYNPLETPIIEMWNTLSVKFGAGADSDAMKEIFRLQDQGGRKIGLRFELTLSMARYVAMNPNLKLPFKRYELGRVYRDGPIKLGRMREFWQCDVDVVGTDDAISDAEIAKLSLDVFKALGLDAYLEVNNRKLLNGILESAGVPKDKWVPTTLVIDKLNKIGIQGVEEELRKIGIESSVTDKMIQRLNVRGNYKETLDALKIMITNETGKEGIARIEEMFSYFSEEDVESIRFTPSLARGLTYYTGTVYEGFLRDSEVTASICGGGRYDDMIGLFSGGKKVVPAIGISFGLVPIMAAFKKQSMSNVKTVTKILVIPIRDTKIEAMKIVQDFRDAGINTELDLMSRGISKNLDYANTMGVPYVVFVGERELAENKVKLKNMESGDEELLSAKDVVKKLK